MINLCIDDLPTGWGTADEAGVGFATERRPDTTLIELRLAETHPLYRQRHVETICRFRARVAFELLDEIARHSSAKARGGGSIRALVPGTTARMRRI